jgi:hypothetical protein
MLLNAGIVILVVFAVLLLMYILISVSGKIIAAISKLGTKEQPAKATEAPAAAPAAAAAEFNAAEAEDDDLDIDQLSSMIEALALGAAEEPDMDLTDAVEMDSLEDLAEAEAGALFEDEE